ncbi:MAG: hypothetical protein COV65_02415 [Nitrosopumilales archaeon CG11_big_fil_rev_8_21_14_0_20_33_24]|nr:MAG: hypothetical protein COV65_02415 [Nitrosopumilales archaeon CG11_big_fil_rev_8_21_14_0_20_33_24]PIY88390.1 MAG: hypothetical protein COY74_08450 [Nitrosopumilales archaeon CG_4_10_14_0_8_um_filter_34_8]PJB96416.1 MAG: hypothetical protein CO079_09880 [Nitrosopumilales archaeon CG_4_9_14_0_8_um_filter_34_10]
MAQSCKGLCIRSKSSSHTNCVRFRYKVGQKFCSCCALFLHTKEFTCSCCKTRLRSKPKSKK